MPNSAARLRSHVSGVGTFVSISFAGCARLSKPSEMKVSCAVFRWSARSVPADSRDSLRTDHRSGIPQLGKPAMTHLTALSALPQRSRLSRFHGDQVVAMVTIEHADRSSESPLDFVSVGIANTVDEDVRLDDEAVTDLCIPFLNCHPRRPR